MAIQECSQETPWATRVARQVEALQRVYGLALLLFSLGIALVLMIGGPSHYRIGKWAGLGLCLEVVALAYVGLRLRRPWVVSLIVFGSANAMIRCIGARSDTLLEGIAKGVWAGLALYQFWFFRRPETREFFRSDGMTLF